MSTPTGPVNRCRTHAFNDWPSSNRPGSSQKSFPLPCVLTLAGTLARAAQKGHDPAGLSLPQHAAVLVQGLCAAALLSSEQHGTPPYLHPYLPRAVRLANALLVHAGLEPLGSGREAEVLALMVAGVQVGAGGCEEQEAGAWAGTGPGEAAQASVLRWGKGEALAVQGSHCKIPLCAAGSSSMRAASAL